MKVDKKCLTCICLPRILEFQNRQGCFCCPFSILKSLVVGWSLCRSSLFLFSHCQPDSLLLWVGASTSCLPSPLNSSQFGAWKELLEATALKRRSRRLWVRRWGPGPGPSCLIHSRWALGGFWVVVVSDPAYG